MKSRLVSLGLALGGLALLTFTPAAAAEVRGQVFLVTNNGAAVKLALAKVYVVTATEMERLSVRTAEGLAQVQKEYAAQASPLHEHLGWLKGASNTIDKLERQSELLQKLAKLRQDREKAALLWMGSPPEGLAPARRTDADGVFRVLAPDDGWIIVHAERRAPEEDIYRWVIPVKTAAKDEVFLFANHNLVEPPPEPKATASVTEPSSTASSSTEP